MLLLVSYRRLPRTEGTVMRQGRSWHFIYYHTHKKQTHTGHYHTTRGAVGRLIWHYYWMLPNQMSDDTLYCFHIGSLLVRFVAQPFCSPFYKHGLPLTPAWISIYIARKVWEEISYPFLNFNGCTVEVYEWISHFVPHLIMDVITYPCHVSERGHRRLLPYTIPVRHAPGTQASFAHNVLLNCQIVLKFCTKVHKSTKVSSFV